MNIGKRRFNSKLMLFFIMMVAAMACLFDWKNATDLSLALLLAGSLLLVSALVNYRVSIILFTQKRE